ncbi:hypothetical protein L208DRAFT_1446391 [Tricholoma matsutake]|nr:hypothetical protein L208DRAFT_1446391 [Tricholoma matsutake 945]
MPIQLPPQPAGVNLPAHPHDPPTLADIVAAKSYKTRVDVAFASQLPNAPTADDAARADVYRTNIITAHSALAAAPAWFQPAMTAIMAPFQVMLAQTQNHLRHDGSFTPFTIVPFNDGSMPTQAPHNLPPLVTAAAIRALTVAQSTAYAVGYALENVGAAPLRRIVIGRAVGCTVPI